MQRYLRAFIQAFRMTLRGEKLVDNSQAGQLERWVKQLALYTITVEQAASQQKLDMASVVMRIDQRKMSMKMLIDLLKFRTASEYPNLLREAGKSGWSVIYTTNINDQYYITRLYDTLPASAVKEQVAALKQHLEQIPLNTSAF